MLVNTAELLTFIDQTDIADADRAALGVIHPMVEQNVKNYVGYSVEQATYTHYLPREDSRHSVESSYPVDIENSRVVFSSGDSAKEDSYLFVPELPLRSITSLYLDTGANYGQGSGDFTASTELTAGTDFYIPSTESGICKSGKIVYAAGSWPRKAGTVKVTYVAGYTEAELKTGIASPIRLAAIITLQKIFNQHGDSQGELVSERLGDWSGTYAKVAGGWLPKEAKSMLKPYMSYLRFL